MNEVMSTGELFERGWAKYDLARRVRDQDLARVRRGAYAEPLPPDASAENRHRQLIAAALPGLHPGAVVSHGSAAVVHALPVWRGALDRVHVTRSIASGGHRRRLVHVHAAPLRDSDVIRVNGVAVTSIARTVLDLARTVPFQQAVSAGDRALALGLDPEALRNGLARMRSWPGVRAAQRSCGFMDPRSESVGESFSRVRFRRAGHSSTGRSSTRCTTRTASCSRGATSAGRSNGRSASSTARSSTTAFSGRVRPAATRCMRRRCVRTPSETGAGRLSDGPGPTSSDQR